MAEEPRDPAPAPVRSDEEVTVHVRRSPKYGVFLLAGAALGVLAALLLTFGFDGTGQMSPNTGVVYSTGQVFGFLCLICIPIGLALTGTLALVLDRVVGRRTRMMRADHAHIRR